VNLFGQLDSRSCVLLRLGDRRFALIADQVVELVSPSRVFRFPHRTSELDGVILRRGRVVPVCDISERLMGKRMGSRRFYLISSRPNGVAGDSIAVPVSGDCELIHADLTPAGSHDSPHVAAWLSHNGEVIEVLNLSALTPAIPETALSKAETAMPEARA
jgi:chemotaxis signal transduction protein